MNFQLVVKWLSFVLLACIAGLSGSLPSGAGAANPVRIEVLSSQANRVTGGNALIRVTAPTLATRSQMVVRLNGQVVTGSLRAESANSRRRTGLLTGIRRGRNWITAWAPGQNSGSRLAIFNSDLQGPLLSGPLQQPFFCTTEALGLGPALNTNCFANTKVSWFYRSSSNNFKLLASPTDRPADLVQTTTRTGETVDYVVRLEQGVINRAVYNFATLAADGRMGNGWNGRFFYLYEGGCSTGHQQGEAASGGLNDDLLRRGFVVLGSSLNVFNTSCNDVLSAETTSMVKEHAIESLGRPDVWTAGAGGSGGSIQIQMIAQNYPGLLDGLNPGASFPDNSSPDYPDCWLLENYFSGNVEGQSLSGAQRRAITGMTPSAGGCSNLANGAEVVNASDGCIETIVPVSVIFDPLTNPGGVRCTIWDNMVNIYGTDPDTGFARRTYDNTGVQYGLQALEEGSINVKRFLDLNEFIGGFDNNGNFQAGRSVADPAALRVAYETGRINQGAGGWSSVPVIDQRNYQDDNPNGNVHQYVNTFRLRTRLDRFNGTHANQVMFRAMGSNNVQPMSAAATDILSDWLDAIASDSSTRPLAEKVIAKKPANAVDACWIGGNRIDGEAAIGATNICQTTFPPHSLPVNRAGRPLDSITAKCTLKPVNPADYGSLTPEQVTRLNQIFPGGVCDWSRPGPEETTVRGTNISFGPAQNVTAANRRLGLRLNRNRVNRSRRGGIVTATATLNPCPAVTWQRVGFQRRIRQNRRWVWVNAGSDMARGNHCRASTRIRRIHNETRIRARVLAITGFRAANSPVRTVRVRRANRHRR
ncbi:MAG TPA: DUF6351 family protein [Solirubrobacterales bacterium]|nr:DUF6351 family protein [Solirubrobacterales bacterium]